MSVREGIRLLFLAIWNEFKTLMLLGNLQKNKHSQSHKSNPKKYHGGMASAENSEFHLPPSEIIKTTTNNSWNQTPIIERIRLFIEMAAFFIALCLAGVYYIQMQANLRQAAASERQLAEMHRQVALDQRAWIYVKIDENNLILIQESTNFFIKPRIENAGKTMAIVKGAYSKCALVTNEIPLFDPVVTNLSMILIPGASSYVNTPIMPFAALTINIPIYYYGTVYYRDIFGESHWIQYCYLVKDGGRITTTMPFHNSCDDAESGKID